MVEMFMVSIYRLDIRSYFHFGDWDRKALSGRLRSIFSSADGMKGP